MPSKGTEPSSTLLQSKAQPAAKPEALTAAQEASGHPASLQLTSNRDPGRTPEAASLGGLHQRGDAGRACTQALCMICLAPMEAAAHSQPAYSCEDARSQSMPANDQVQGKLDETAAAKSKAEAVEQACCRSCRQQILRPMKARKVPSGQAVIAELLPPAFLCRLQTL